MKRIFLALICLGLFSLHSNGQQRRIPPRPRTAPRQQQPVEKPTKEPITDTKERAPIQFLLPEDIPWPKSANPTAPRNITLLGDPREPALYVTRTLIPQGTKGIPHLHADTRTVVVVSGTYYYGTGDTFDEKKLVALPPGSLILEPVGQPHYTWAKDGEVIVQTTGIGPTSTEFPQYESGKTQN